MFINPDLATQLAREHHRELLAQASQRQRRHRGGHPSPGTPGAAGMGGRLTAAIARAGIVVTRMAGAIGPAGPHPLGEAATPARTPRA